MTIGLIGLFFMLLLFGILFSLSTGNPIPFTDENGISLPGSISEKIFVDINGVRQGMFIKSRDETNPVLLFVHGGPGMPEYFLTQKYPTDLEENFTVVWWEQRGAGLSFSPDISPETMTIDQLVEDTLVVSNYLRNRFGKEKIYLMGHSGGSFIGILAAYQAPELYYAYIGMAQMSYQLESENLAYDYMLAEYKKNGNEKMVEKLENAPPGMVSPLPDAYLMLRDDAMHRLGIGTTMEMKSVISGIFIPSLLNKEYTLKEKFNIWRGKSFSAGYLRNEMFSIDLTQKVQTLDLPVYFLHGKYDYTCSYDMANDYLDELQAPVKGFYTFEQSAHSPIFEEPGRMMEILQNDVLSGVNYLADD
ncbi:MAG: alpha/beta hydrolase [Anaerolineaceae bacterium]|nr:alpha/beta hydrolase [Anaerolineaceae bacterium]